MFFLTPLIRFSLTFAEFEDDSQVEQRQKMKHSPADVLQKVRRQVPAKQNEKMQKL